MDSESKPAAAKTPDSKTKSDASPKDISAKIADSTSEKSAKSVAAAATKSVAEKPAAKAPAAPEKAATKAPEPVKPAPVVEGTVFAAGKLIVTSASLSEGTEIAAFAGSYTLGKATVAKVQSFGRAEFRVKDLPDLEFPFEIRFVNAATGAEILTPLRVADAAAALTGLGDRPTGVKIAALFDDQIVFELTSSRLPGHGRPLSLLVNGRSAGEAVSTPQAADPDAKANAARLHQTRFTLDAPLRDGALLELTDVASGSMILSRTLTWVNLVGAVMNGQKLLEKRLREMETTLAKLSAQVAAGSSQARERVMLERLDLFYSLIQDRLDRELRALNVPAPVIPPLVTRDDIHVAAAQVEGTGYYELEVSGLNSWRWFGPRTTLVFREVHGPCKTLRLSFTSLPKECDIAQMAVRINGRPAEIKAEGKGGQLTVTAKCDPVLFAAARQVSLIVETEFPYYFKVEGDDRVLSAAFTGAVINY